ncbi:MAG: alpha-amylase [Bacteroidetes bacterium]|nr:alpha-amylase [Bacteroidota bacterium]
MIWYSIFVRSFVDSNNDGIGDLKGIIQHLDYLAELGVEGIWLSPIHRAPSYHKYDMIDYYSIDPEYGSIADFKLLIQAAHQRKIKVMLDMVFNHCSEQHPWFLQALSSKKNKYRSYFNWMDSQEMMKMNLSDWHVPEKGPKDECYYGLFWKGMPDWNFDHPELRKEMINIAQFWIQLGVDALRLDAAMHIFPPGRENDNVIWWQEMRKALGDKIFMVGEITQSPSYIQPYFKKGLSSAFNFDLAEKIIQAILHEQHNCLGLWLAKVQHNFSKTDSNVCDSIFLSNHDQVRVASRWNGDVRKSKLAASILCSLPGEIFIYYGEELGMLGLKPDEFVREAFPWTWEPSTQHCSWLKSKYNLPTTLPSYQQQKPDPQSIFNHYQTLLAIRKNHLALTQGKIENVICNDPSVLIFTRKHAQQQILVMHNLTGVDVILRHEDASFEYMTIHATSENPSPQKDSFHVPAYGTLMVDVKM